ncbi:MAG: YncE family protein [Ignavibacteriales bacterium]|nr:YncE family protein [Ignavibacteriales bacterium]
MKMLVRYVLYIFLGMILLQPAKLFSQKSAYKIVGAINIGGEGKWDYLSIDTTMHRLYVAHETRVHVIDLDNNTLIGEISDLQGVHGVAFAFGKGFISEGVSNSVTVFDLKTLKPISKIKVTGEKPDAITYDPFSKRIFTSNNKSADITAIDAESNKIVGTIKLDGAPEASVSDLIGKMFVNLEDTNAVNIFNPKTLEVISRWSVKPCKIPTGLAIDRKNKRLFSAGRNNFMAVIDMESGMVIKTVPIGGGVDGCVFDPMLHLIFCSNGDGTITVIKQDSPDKYRVLANIVTVKGAKTIALDERTHRVYTAGIINGEKNLKSFGVLILDVK